MSATNRGEARDPLDFNRTPAYAVRAVLPYVGQPLTVLDLGCGDGAIGTVLREHLGESANIYGIEVDAGRAKTARSLVSSVRPSKDPCRTYDEVLTMDASKAKFGADEAVDVVMSNPPFAHAVDFLGIANRAVRPGGSILFLLRGTWMVPAVRANIATPDLLFLRRRPSFKKSAKGNSSDSADYAWHHFRPDYPGHGGHWTVLECEPAKRGKRP